MIASAIPLKQESAPHGNDSPANKEAVSQLATEVAAFLEADCIGRDDTDRLFEAIHAVRQTFKDSAAKARSERPAKSKRPKPNGTEPAKPRHVRGIGRCRLKVLARHGFRCCYCGTDLLASITALDGATIDHLWPRCRGGDLSQENAIASCASCNSLKADYQPADLEDARAHVMAKRSEFVAYFLQLLEYHDVDLPDEREGNAVFRQEMISALGTFAGQADAIMQRLKAFDVQARAVLERFAGEEVESPFA